MIHCVMEKFTWDLKTYVLCKKVKCETIVIADGACA